MEMDDYDNLHIECKIRAEDFQVDCGKLMMSKRSDGTIDAETYDMLSKAYSVSGNAAREIGLMLDELRTLRKKLAEE